MNTNQQLRNAWLLAFGALVCGWLCVLAWVQLSGPGLLRSPTVAVSPKLVTVQLDWKAYNPKVLISVSTTLGDSMSKLPTGSGFSNLVEVTTIVRNYLTTAPAIAYTLWRGTNMVTSTTKTSATVTYLRGTAPSFDLHYVLSDGRTGTAGTFTLPKDPQTSGMLYWFADAAATPNGQWQEFTNGAVVVNCAQFAKPAGFFRTRLRLDAFGTNATGFVFTPKVFAITNSP